MRATFRSKLSSPGRWLVPMASVLLLMCVIAVGMVWRNQARRATLTQTQTYIAETIAIDGLRAQLDRVVAEVAVRSQDKPLADLINRARASALAAAPIEPKP